MELLNKIKQALFISTAICLSLSSLVSCSSKPYTGEKLTITEVGAGATLAQTEERHLQPDGKIAGEDAALIQVQAKVSKINYKNRRLTLKDSDGKSTEILAGQEVKNFAQIKIGDQVSVGYYISVAFEVRQPTAEEIDLANTSIQISARAEKGEKPAAVSARGHIKIATVESINKERQTVTLKGLEGPDALTPVKAKYPENLTTIKIGDKAVITITEAHAVSVDKM